MGTAAMEGIGSFLSLLGRPEGSQPSRPPSEPESLGRVMERLQAAARRRRPPQDAETAVAPAPVGRLGELVRLLAQQGPTAAPKEPDDHGGGPGTDAHEPWQGHGPAGEHEHDGHGHEPGHDHDHGHEHGHGHGHGPWQDHGDEGEEQLEVCALLPRESAVIGEGLIAAGIGVATGTPLVALADTFRLSSNPTASKTIYLDFDGHTTTGTSWNNTTMGASFFSPAYDIDNNPASFSNSELTLIQQIWQRVAADFAAFDINVTTLAPPSDWLIRSSSSDPNYGIRVVVTSFGPSSSTAGGIAFIDSFSANTDTPCFVYNKSLLGVSEASSHEVGHTLGLAHDGNGGGAYYQGHGTGETSWAPIMGVGYYTNVTTWDNGTYFGSNNGSASANYNRGPDDLAIISGVNGFSTLPDQEGNNQATANALSIQAGSVSQFGTIETSSDLDWYRFTLSDLGSISLSFDPYWYRAFIDNDGLWGGSARSYYASVSDANSSSGWVDNASNLDLGVELYNSLGTLIASSNPAGLAASLNVSNLAADTYFLRLDGVGFGTPTTSPPSGYSDYASIGGYRISGTIVGASPEPVLSMALGDLLAISESGSDLLLFTLSRSGDTSNALTANVLLGGSATLASDYQISGWSPGLNTPELGTVTFAAGSATALVSITPLADGVAEPVESISLQIAAGTGYGIATTAAVVGTISELNPLPPVPPAISLSLTPAAVLEGGASSLVYTFSRTGTTSTPLTVNFRVAGTATINVDYSGVTAAGTTGSVTFAAGAATAQVSVTPINDSTIESNETVALTLLANSNYTIATAATFTGTITDDDVNPAPTTGNDLFIFTPSQDILTGLAGNDTYRLIDLKNSLLGNGSSLDRVTDLVPGADIFDSPFRTTAMAPLAAGSVTALTSNAIGGRLNNTRFAANGAATFTLGSGTTQRIFLGINDNVAGYQSGNDAIIEITGVNSTLLANLRVS